MAINFPVPAKGGAGLYRPRTAKYGGWIAFIFLAAAVVIVLLLPLFPQFSFSSMGAARLAPPLPAHWFGTDEFGRDILARTMYALRTSFWVAALAVAISTVIGVALGLTAGYIGSVTDAVMMRFFDALLAFPSLILAIGVTAVMGPGAFSAAIAVGIVGIPQMARITRAETLGQKQLQYVEAAKTVGVSTPRILIRHILPNVAPPIFVQIVLFFVIAVMTEAGLSFLGFGVQVPTPSLGSMLESSRPYLQSAPWYAIAPGLVLAAVIFAIQTLAEHLRSRLNTRG